MPLIQQVLMLPLAVRLQNQKGTSLVELIIGSVMIIVGILGITLAISRAMHSNQNDRQRFQAQSALATEIQRLKAIPLPLIPLSPTGAFSGGSPCNCQNNVSWAAVAPTTISQNNTTYSLQVCTNRVEQSATGGTFTYLCPADALTINEQTSYRYIRARISWTSHNNTTEFLESETLVGNPL